MALLVLIVLGATIGWLASILMRSEAPREILRQIGVGLVATLAVGLIANSGTFLGGLSFIALGSGMGAGIIALVAYHMLIKPKAEEA